MSPQARAWKFRSRSDHRTSSGTRYRRNGLSGIPGTGICHLDVPKREPPQKLASIPSVGSRGSMETEYCWV
jgi:hypothetical protein